jgi:predicted DNA-binding transcriptional regulator AlpA
MFSSVRNSTVEKDRPVERLWTKKNLAEFCEVPEATVSQWIYKGTAPKSIRVGRYVRFERAAIEQWLDERRQPDAVEAG